MNCLNCNTPNDPKNLFCVNCGQPLSENMPPPPNYNPLARTEAQLLGIHTGRLLIALLALWLAKAILVRMPFTRYLRIPVFLLTVETMITIVGALFALVLLIAYARSLRALWPYAFPNAASILAVPLSLVYLAILIALYYALRPIAILIDPAGDVLLWLQVILVLIAIMVLIYAGIVLYQYLPTQLSKIRITGLSSASHEFSCLNCGTLNQTGSQFCKNCGEAMSPGASE